ncbi:hypothetical protein [Paenibacillus dauci]|uniref:hypothetical protein n=1 Tax=Paenibacillus dauci TaxID=1567106 RepID=UPI000619C331|nr:hypothetical protein [Paenibacillus dauci]
MLSNKEEYSSVPKSIELLFENEKLELMKVLCLIYSISLESKRYIPISEILFYYSLTNFNLISIFEETNEATSPNLFFRFQSRIGNIVIQMENLNFIKLKASLATKNENIKIKVSKTGQSFYEEHNSAFFQELQQKYISTFAKVSYNASTLKKLKEGKG